MMQLLKQLKNMNLLQVQEKWWTGKWNMLKKRKLQEFMLLIIVKRKINYVQELDRNPNVSVVIFSQIINWNLRKGVKILLVINVHVKDFNGFLKDLKKLVGGIYLEENSLIYINGLLNVNVNMLLGIMILKLEQNVINVIIVGIFNLILLA